MSGTSGMNSALLFLSPTEYGILQLRVSIKTAWWEEKEISEWEVGWLGAGSIDRSTRMDGWDGRM